MFKSHLFRAFLFVILCTGAVGAQEDTVQVSVPDISARPGDQVLVPVQISGLTSEIVSGEVRVEFDPAVLQGLEAVRRGTLTENQRWLTADQIDTTDSGKHVFQVVFAAATGFTENGDILFLSFQVNENAAIGTTTDLSLTLTSFNNGTPSAALTNGSLRVVEEVIMANFVARPRRGSVPLQVQFNENSVGTIDTYAWDFGDGSTTDEQNPQHLYTDPGSYTVALTVTGTSGQDTETKFDYIVAQPDTTAPQITEGPKATGVKRTSATILWITNEFSTSFVEYSTAEDFPASQTVSSDELVKAHKVELGDLEPNTKYYYRVRSTDAAGNASAFKRGFFRTKRAADTKPPVITKGPSAEEITDVSASIVWRTNEEANSIVEYLALADGDDGFDGAQRLVVDELVEDHRVGLSGLQPSTRYIYRVRSVDDVGNESNYKRGTFKSRNAPDTRPPVIEFGPVAVARTHQSATIKWSTNEPVSALVNYGTGTDYGFSESRSSRRDNNKIRLTNLEPSTLYHYQVVSTDAAGNVTTSEDSEFITRSKPDRTFPKIVLRPFILGRFADRLIVRWQTDEPCLGVVEYGVADDGDDFEFIATSQEEGREHTVVLTDLDPDSEYKFRVSVTDLSGNGPVVSRRARGRTLKDAAAALPRIMQGPIVANRGFDRAKIAWRTNLPTDGFVDFGADATYGNRAGSAELALEHEVVLSDLTAATTYHFRVVSSDPDDNEISSEDQTLTTRAAADTLAPIFTRGPAAVGLTDSSAFVAWRTNEPADALVEFGPDLNYGDSVLEEEFDNSQRLSLTGLEPGQTYHFRISARDRAGNGPTVSGDVSFTTLETQDVRPPAIIAGPGARDVRQNEVTIVWRTDEPGDSFVDFGEDESYGNTVGSAELTRDHQVTLTNLASGTQYHYRINSTDLAGNTSSTDPNGNQRWSRSHTVSTLQVPDTNAPAIIRGPVIIAGNKGAVISFRTDERCIARLAYGTAQTLGTAAEEVVYETEPTTRHNIRIGNLEKRTRYLFRLTCVDASGNELVVGSKRRRAAKIVPVAGAEDFGDALEFSTEEEDDVQPPIITEGPTLVSRTADTAIIEWTTDEPADSFIDFGIGALSERVGDAEYTQEHSIVLTGLQASTAYTYQVNSTDFVGNAPATSQSLSFTTQAEPDLVPPALAGDPAIVFVDDSQAIIEWATDESASVELLYGAGQTRDQVFFSSDFASQHTAHLAGLESGTDYTYLIRLSDPSGNGPAESAVLNFTTESASDVTVPTLAAIGASEVGDVQVIIEWTTDEPANSFVFYGTDLELAVGDAELVTAHRVVLTNLSAATTYDFAVESLDPAGNTSGQSPTQSFTTAAGPDVEAPTALAGVAALIGLETAIVTWPSVAVADLASYTLYRQISTGPFQAIATGLADTAYTDAGLIFGTPYNYYVTATDLTGNESEPSDAVGGTPSIRNVPGAISPFGATISGNNVTLQVSNAQAGQLGGELTYIFHVSTGELFDDIVASTSGVEQGAGSTSWAFEKELEEGVEYWWRARASDGTFDGPWSFPSFFDGPAAVSANLGDFDNDGTVGFSDFFVFADKFGLGAGDVGYDAIYDLDGSTPIGFSDFFIFADLFGTNYSSSRPLTGRTVAEFNLVAQARLQGDDEVIVELRTQEAVDWRGLGLLLRYDPAVLTWMGEEGQHPDLLAAAPAGLYAQIATGADEIALFAHRRQQEGFSGAGSVAYLRFRTNEQVGEAVLQLGAAAVQTHAGIAQLQAPQSFAVRLLPEHYALLPNYPNPFNPETTIAYDLADEGRVRLAVYDVLGQQVRVLIDGAQAAGRYRMAWDGRDRAGRAAASGVYFLRLEANGFSQVRKMMLVR